MQYLNVNERQNSLSSIYSSSMESLSSLHGAESYWSIDQELTPISTAIDIKDYNIYGTTYTISRLRAKTSDYNTGFFAAKLDEERKHKKNGRLRVRKVSASDSLHACVGYWTTENHTYSYPALSYTHKMVSSSVPLLFRRFPSTDIFQKLRKPLQLIKRLHCKGQRLQSC